MSDYLHELLSILLFLALIVSPVYLASLGTEYAESFFVAEKANEFLTDICEDGVTAKEYAYISGALSKIHWDVTLVITKDGIYMTEEELLDALTNEGSVSLNGHDRAEIYIKGRHCLVYKSRTVTNGG